MRKRPEPVKPGAPALHRYRPHPHPPQRSIDLGRVKCFTCGMYEDSPLHYEVVSASKVRPVQAIASSTGVHR